MLPPALVGPDTPTTPQESYVISLIRRPDRREQVQEQFTRENIPYTLVDAVDGHALPLPPEWEKAGAGAMGCHASHLDVLRRVQEAGHQCVAVYEDDVVLVDGYREKLNALIEAVTKLDPSWDAIFPGGQHTKPPEATSDPGLVRCLSTVRTHSFVIRGPYYKLLYDCWLAGADHVDHQWAYGNLQRDHRVYAPRDWLCSQAAGQSDVNGRMLSERKWPVKRVIERPSGCRSCGKRKKL